MTDQVQKASFVSRAHHSREKVVRSRTPLTVLALSAAMGWGLWSPTAMASPTPAKLGEAASAQPSRAECLAAHHSAQELKQKDMLLEAQQKLLVCSSGTCPGAVIADCGSWMTDLEQRTPSMVLEVHVDGKTADDVKVFVDQEPVTDWSHAIKVNPGRHVVRAEVPHFDPNEQSVVLPEGQRMRLIAIDFKSPTPPPALAVSSPKPEPAVASDVGGERRPVPAAVYPLLGVGIAGLAAFGIFAAVGHSKQSDLEHTCEPHCTDSDLSSMKGAYLVGDISGAVGVASLLGAAIVYFSRPIRPAGIALDFGPITATAARSWGGSVTATW